MKDDYLQSLLKENAELHNKITAYHAVLCDHNLLDEAKKQAKEFEKMLNSDCLCEERKQTHRPFKDCDELIEFWTKHHQTGFRAAHTKPLIWVRLKVDKRERLIVAFGTDFVEIGNKAKAVTLQHLFEQYEFLDGSPVGMEVKE